MNEIVIDNKLEAAVKAAVTKADSIVVDTEESLLTATDIVKFIKEKSKHIEKERKGLVDPLNTHVKMINARFKHLSEPLDAAENILKGKMLTYQRQLEAQRRAAEEKKRKEVEKYAQEIVEQHREEGNEQLANTLTSQLAVAMKQPVEIEKVRGAATGAVSSITKRWTFKVTDIKALANTRPDLVEAVSAQIRKEIAAGAREIIGLDIYQEESVSIR